MSENIYGFKAMLGGKEVELSDYKGKVLLIVNTASKCGLTPQFKDLQLLQDKYEQKGFTVLGFPCNQFNNQDPGTDEEIKSFCSLNYGVTFPMFSKIEVNGKNTHPLYKFLKSKAPGILLKSIKWNFTKFLINRQGNVIKRFGPTTNPADLENFIEKVL
ncbi:MAG: glutathione peroxidase [bacterium]